MTIQKIDRHHRSNPWIEQLNGRDRIELAEYATLIGSALGSIVAGLSGQVLFAATPLTLAIGVNMLKRNRLEDYMNEQHRAAIADIHRVVESLHTSLEKLPPEERVADLEGTTVRISEALVKMQAELEARIAKTDPLKAESLREELAILRRAIVRLRDQTDANFSQMQANFDREIKAVREQVLSHPTHPETLGVERLQGDLATLANGLDDLRDRVNSLETPADAFASPLTDDRLQTLDRKVERLESDNQEKIKPLLKHLIRAVKQIDADRRSHTGDRH
ncbi:hypothetical protein JJD41_06830 [Oxynema sp. CENA135]|uniref:hypothetical protein n=1 Tax=Oxynema sp. CENA135 TaxID=984206 RepID=UPI00190CADAC|nr:hypothetical protein [Oxynema sp. CENA135]MBK4729582.1 hypothetical protein [Oxynema sp. CENA135]